tara:strand:- start:3778 stop:3987 length:210 start_codon:yes stop_codon:yes gene_type:complete
MKLCMPRTGNKELDEALMAIEEASEKVSCEWEKRQQRKETVLRPRLVVNGPQEELDIAAFTRPEDWEDD